MGRFLHLINPRIACSQSWNTKFHFIISSHPWGTLSFHYPPYEINFNILAIAFPYLPKSQIVLFCPQRTHAQNIFLLSFYENAREGKKEKCGGGGGGEIFNSFNRSYEVELLKRLKRFHWWWWRDGGGRVYVSNVDFSNARRHIYLDGRMKGGGHVEGAPFYFAVLLMRF